MYHYICHSKLFEWFCHVQVNIKRIQRVFFPCHYFSFNFLQIVKCLVIIESSTECSSQNENRKQSLCGMTCGLNIEIPADEL